LLHGNYVDATFDEQAHIDTAHVIPFYKEYLIVGDWLSGGNGIYIKLAFRTLS